MILWPTLSIQITTKFPAHSALVKQKRKILVVSQGQSNTVKFRNKPQGLYFSKALFELGLIFGGAYLQMEVCVSKSAKLILGGKFAP